MSSNNLYKLALLVIFVLVTIQIINIFNQKPVIIEPKTEHMNPSLLTHQYEDLQKEPSDQPKLNFYYKDNRYSNDNNFNPQLVDPLHQETGLQCTPQFDWDIKLNPGANNVYGDNVWHTSEPKMVLENNCMSCGQFQPSDSFNEPTGIESSLLEQYDNSIVVGSLLDQAVPPFNTSLEEMIDVQRKWGSVSSGLPPLPKNDEKTCGNHMFGNQPNGNQIITAQGKVESFNDILHKKNQLLLNNLPVANIVLEENIGYSTGFGR